MDKARAEKIIAQDSPFNCIEFWNESNPNSVTLDGEFDIETLEAIIVVLKHRIATAETATQPVPAQNT